MMIKAIETQYRGYRFRSRLEARYAVFFDALGITWQYELEGYDLGELGWYLPDFWLPEVRTREGNPGTWIEVKGTEPTEKEMACGAALARGSEHPVLIGVGMPDRQSDSYYPGNLWEVDGFGDTWMAFLMCRDCGCIYIHFPGEGSYRLCPECGSHRVDDDYPRIDSAIAAARSARFEYGETPMVGAVL